MKTFLRKMKLSFLAMLCGWIACNVAWWVAYSIVRVVQAQSGISPNVLDTALFESHRLEGMLLVAVISGIWIAIAWLGIFLPVDLCVSDDSRLRKPKVAALCGFMATSTIMALLFLCAVAQDAERLGWKDSIIADLDYAVRPYVLGTCATGTVAAFIRACMDKNKPRTEP